MHVCIAKEMRAVFHDSYVRLGQDVLQITYAFLLITQDVKF